MASTGLVRWAVARVPEIFYPTLTVDGVDVLGPMPLSPPYDPDDATSVQAWLEGEVQRR